MAAPATLQEFADIDDLEAKKKLFLKKLGDLSKWKITKNYVLLAVWIGGKFVSGTKVQLLRTNDSLKEDIFQGRCGLLIKCGPLAFKEKIDGKWVDEDGRPQLHEWATFTSGEGRHVQINGIDCRVLHEDAIYGTTPDPEALTYRN